MSRINAQRIFRFEKDYFFCFESIWERESERGREKKKEFYKIVGELQADIIKI